MTRKRYTTVNLYLRTIRKLSAEKETVRNADIAKELGFSRPSVTAAVKRLKSDGLVAEDSREGICLTGKGKEAADKSEERVRTLVEHFRVLGLDDESALEDAGNVEHLISDELYEAVLSLKREQ